MCGICGYFNWDNEAALDRMLEALYRRGPDDVGKHCEPGIGLGIRRLSIIDVKGGRQPVSNESGTIWAVFNGEIYNYRPLREWLTAKGHRLRSASDTEVIVHLYEEDGELFARRLRGMFAISLWDSEKKIMYLIRDRFGIKPLYYAEHENGVIFASELPALREAIPSVTLNLEAITRYLMLGYIPRPRTIFTAVKQVSTGEILKLEGSIRKTFPYYDLYRAAMASPLFASRAELEEQFRERLKETVLSHMVSDVPLGLLLSSGLDSGAILAMMRSASNGPVKTFSIGYKGRSDSGFNETDNARFMAHHFGADHTEELLSPNVFSLLDNVIDAMGEPFSDSSAIPTFLVSEVARRKVTVALSGIGGDELFGGYPRYLGIKASAYYQRVPAFIRRFIAHHAAPLFRETGTQRDQRARLKRFLKSGLLPLDQQYLQWITLLPAEWGKNAFSPDILPFISLSEELSDYQKLWNEWPSAEPADKAMGLDLQTYLVGDLLRMGDRLSMWHSLELRVPFCDHELLSFALSISASTRLHGWKLKGFMRGALRDMLPKKILRLPKRGFMVPLARWLREDLRDMTRDLLSGEAIKRRGFLNPAYVQWLLTEHASGMRNFSDQIFSLLVLELWLQKFEKRVRK